jgi:hypothetical protein
LLKEGGKAIVPKHPPGSLRATEPDRFAALQPLMEEF